jgi:tRNA dimethylallyltransferase
MYDAIKQGIQKQRLIVICGPTGCGKTEVAVRLCERLGGEIISCDSRKVYRYLDIGTSKPKEEFQQRVRFHLLDIIDPDEEFTVHDYMELAEQAIEEIITRGKLPFLVGGSGLYLRAVTKGLFSAPKGDRGIRRRLEKEAEEIGASGLYKRLCQVDMVAAKRIGQKDVRRIIRALQVYEETGRPISSLQKEWRQPPRRNPVTIGLIRDRIELYERINARVDRMIQDGLVDEVKRLIKMGYKRSLRSFEGLGYRQIMDYLTGIGSLGDAVEEIKKVSRHYAKRQITWFKKEEGIRWFHPDDFSAILLFIEKELQEGVNN